MSREKLGNLFDFLTKSTRKASDGRPQGAFPFFTSSPEQTKWSDTSRYQVEALVFGTGGSASVHHVSVPFDTSTDCLVATPNRREAVHARYCFHYLSWNIGALEAGFRGAGLRHVSKSYIQSLDVLLPALSEQRRIADLLDRVEAVRARRRAALAQLDTLTQSIFLDMFGDPVRNDKGWSATRVSEICELVRGSSPRPQGDPRFFGGPVPRLMVADITRDGWLVTPKIDSLTVEGAKRSRPVPAGAVVMAVSGNVGVVSRLAIDACVHDGFVAFTDLNESRCEAGFLLALLHFSKALHERHKAGAIFINLTTTDIKAMQLPLPPLTLQREFVRRVTAVEKLMTTQRVSLGALDGLFVSVQHRGFRGKL